MKPTHRESHLTTPLTTNHPATWSRSRTIAVRPHPDTRAAAATTCPTLHAYTPPDDADRAAEEPERWDGLS